MATDCNQGFTLLDLLLTITIAGILLGLGIPSFNQVLRSSRLTTSINQLVVTMNFARSTAISHNQAVSVRKSGANWEQGWTVFVDHNGNGEASTKDTVLRTYAALPNGYSLRSRVNRVTFRPSGTSGGSSFGLCDNSAGNNKPKSNTARMMIISPVGRVRMATDKNHNGIPETANNKDMASCTPPF